ncbi:MAG: FHA domain-containing protein [Anaerolineae bacterium]|nr:FHA domain-containing protein [Anaerolineae bacterium]
MYKYNCRKCPIRNRCIDESDNSPSVKSMIRHAFDARTDTLTAWDRLQRSCLLVKAEEERARQAAEGSLLSRRLREARETREDEEKEAASRPKQSPDYLRPVSPQTRSKRPKLKPLTSSVRPKLRPLSSSASPKLNPPSSPQARSGSFSGANVAGDVSGLSESSSTVTVPAESLGSTPKRPQRSEPARPHWLTVKSDGRHIVLPTNGELILGRFDPNIGVPPDIDFSYEDEGVGAVSRRHARIAGAEGYHTIEDLGSRQGVLLNGKRLEFGLRHQLQSGDRIILGKVELRYDAIPSHMLIISPSDQVRHRIIVTPTGRRITIAPPNELSIGRADTYVNVMPDIDLSQDGEIAKRVSRHHAIITWRQRMPYIEDSGSGLGTRVNGKMLLLGQAVQLKPGDHIWLGGCVLAYDVDL